MVDHHIRDRGITDGAVLAAMGQVPATSSSPRPTGARPTTTSRCHSAGGDHLPALPGGADDLAARARAGRHRAEIGTGSGYHTAVLSRIARKVYSMEIIKPIGEQARDRLARLGYANVEVRIGDGYQGWPERAPSTPSS